jgi:radical SAM protein with 4Fe4S-binding SPASM domain
VLFSIQRPDSKIRDIFRFLFPQQAVILSLFNGQRNLGQVKEDIAYLFDLNEEEASELLQAVLELPVGRDNKVKDLLVEVSQVDPGRVRFYDPHDFIVPYDQIDMTKVRCQRPTSLMILPTLRCYVNCRYCYADRQKARDKNEFSLHLFDRLLSEMWDCGMETAEFSGGDLFCREDAEELIGCVLSRGMYASIPTKYPLERNQIKRLAELGLSNMQISIDALTPRVIDSLVRMAGYGERILRTIELLAEFGIMVRTNSVITRHNSNETISLARYLVNLPHVYRMNFTCYSRSIYHHHDNLFCSPDEIKVFERKLNELKVEHPEKDISFNGDITDPYDLTYDQKEANFSERAFCTANRRSLTVLPDGHVTICEELYYHPHFIVGNLKTQSLLEIWNSHRCLELAFPHQETFPDGPCSTCPDFESCNYQLGRCPREAIKAYGPERHHWPDPRCPRAPLGRRLA